MAEALEPDEIIRVSPSQVKRWRDCQRWWAFEKVEKRRDPPGAKALFGTTGHGHLEDWVRDGTAFPDTAAGRCAQRLAPWTAAPRDDRAIVEGRGKMFEIDDVVPGVIINGYLDVELPPGVLNKKAPVVIDYKFTSSLRWAMSSEELLADPQGLLYFLHASKRYNKPMVDARWLYCEFHPKTYEPKGRREVRANFSRGNAEMVHNLGLVLADVADIAEAKRTVTKAIDLPPNPGACGKFGGCPHRSVCPRSTAVRLGALFDTSERMKDSRHEVKSLTLFKDAEYNPTTKKKETSVMNMLEKLKANVKKNKGEEPEEKAAEAPAAKEEQTTSTAPPAASTTISKLQAMSAAAGTAGPDATPAPEAPAEPDVTPPPEAPAEPDATPEPAPQAKGKPGVYERCKQLGCKKRALDGGYCGGDKCINPSVDESKRGLDKGAKAPPKPKAEKPVKAEKDLTADMKHVETVPMKEAPKSDRPIGMLLIDCHVPKMTQATQASHINLADFVQGPMQAVAKHNKVAHWSLGEYGCGKGELVAHVRELLSGMDAGYLGVVVCSSRSMEFAVLETLLIAASDLVIRGGA